MSRAARARRPWTSRDEKRLEDLIKSVERAVPVVGTQEAVKMAVLSALKLETVQQLADRLGAHRPNISSMFAGRMLAYETRRQLDRELRIPPGGMERVLSFLETSGE